MNFSVCKLYLNKPDTPHTCPNEANLLKTVRAKKVNYILSE